MQFSDFKLVERFDWNPVLHLPVTALGRCHVVRCTLLAYKKFKMGMKCKYDKSSPNKSANVLKMRIFRVTKMAGLVKITLFGSY